MSAGHQPFVCNRDYSGGPLWFAGSVVTTAVKGVPAALLWHAPAALTMDTCSYLLKGQQRQAAEALDHLLAQA